MVILHRLPERRSLFVHRDEPARQPGNLHQKEAASFIDCSSEMWNFPLQPTAYPQSLAPRER
jgi:hypothetical protein